MDRYSKAVLTVIAISLVCIAVKLWQPTQAIANPLLGGGPTVGDLMDIREIKDSARRSKANNNLIRNVPLVEVDLL